MTFDEAKIKYNEQLKAIVHECFIHEVPYEIAQTLCYKYIEDRLKENE